MNEIFQPISATGVIAEEELTEGAYLRMTTVDTTMDKK
jgi:hypothetical protein